MARVRRPIRSASSACEGRTRISPSSRTSTAARPVAVGGGEEGARLGVGDVEPAVGDPVARQEVTRGVGVRREPVADEPQAGLGEPRGRRRLPLLQELVEDRVEALLRRAPRLHQVVVEADLVDRLDGGLGVGVGGQQHAPGVGRRPDRPAQEVDPGHLRHALVRDQQRDRLAAADDLLDHAQAGLAGVGEQDAVAGAVALLEVALDRPAHREVVVDGEDQRPRRRGRLHRASTLRDGRAPAHAARRPDHD